ncbi:hypothetical protein DDZ14_17935 [Maritimibacter sp. 55A14]|uniref:MAPEG family protein n=1 Tax=Maritimibacter sp. 55A14 TaxID=2174844 RepID=UPI000D61C081|nr:MAPEG family protein [Maritimibacter sp. 55A14]PWE29251.1 hypothetical protein DDZ14_17935 [Maritimibacter sp. 55A14]
MTPELTALALAGLLQALQFCLMAVPANLELGTGYTTSPRDRDPSHQMSPRTGRLHRALSNHFEGLVLFTLAVAVVTLAGKANAFTAAMAYTYLGARILYVPAYAFGWSPWRSLIWAVGFLATVLILIASLL